MSAPFFFAPTGLSTVAHPDGELNVTRACARAHLVQAVSSVAGKPLEDIAEERNRLAPDEASRPPLWFQLYVRTRKEDSEERIRAAEANGYTAVLMWVSCFFLRVNG